MSTFLLFCFTALCFSPVPIFFLGVFFWYFGKYPENKKPPTVPVYW